MQYINRANVGHKQPYELKCVQRIEGESKKPILDVWLWW